MPHDPDEVRYLQAADQRLAGLSIPSADRQAVRRATAALIRTEDESAAASNDAAAEALAERQRIHLVVKIGIEAGKGRQALRAALLAPLGLDTARGLLATMKADGKAAPEAVAVPAFVAFGSPAAEAERRRITTAFSRPEAAQRFNATAALVLDGDGRLTGEQIAPLLATLPVQVVDPLADFYARVDEGGWFGPSDREAPAPSQAEASRSGWSKAVAEANRQIGAAPPIAAPQPAVIAGPFDAPPALSARA